MIYQKLFIYFAEEHGIHLLDNEIQEVIRLVEEIQDKEIKERRQD